MAAPIGCTDRSAFGAATSVQIMVKDSKKYASTGGQGFGRQANLQNRRHFNESPN
jgi:hypothetical protein